MIIIICILILGIAISMLNFYKKTKGYDDKTKEEQESIDKSGVYMMLIVVALTIIVTILSWTLIFQTVI